MKLFVGQLALLDADAADHRVIERCDHDLLMLADRVADDRNIGGRLAHEGDVDRVVAQLPDRLVTVADGQ